MSSSKQPKQAARAERLRLEAGAAAAAEQGRYWSFVELFYRNQGMENSGFVTDDFLEAVARGAGVQDLGRWDAARQDLDFAERLQAAADRASKLGFNATPSFLVEGPNGRETFTAPSLQALRAAIEQVG